MTKNKNSYFSKTLIPLTNVDEKSLETEFLIAICHSIGDKWRSKTLFIAIFDLCSSIDKSVFFLPPIQCDLWNKWSPTLRHDNHFLLWRKKSWGPISANLNFWNTQDKLRVSSKVSHLISGSHQRRMPRFKSAHKAPSFLFTFPKM